LLRRRRDLHGGLVLKRRLFRLSANVGTVAALHQLVVGLAGHRRRDRQDENGPDARAFHCVPPAMCSPIESSLSR
jgi:hypothetical protein